MAILVNNKKALFEYEVLEKFEAGIVLAGWEVKSLRSGKGSLQESYIYLKNGATWLSGAHIAKWPGMLEPDQKIEYRERKLLLNERELQKLQTSSKIKGNTITALNFHTSRNKIKLDIALVRGKKQHDKRAAIREREMRKEIAKDVKNFRW